MQLRDANGEERTYHLRPTTTSVYRAVRASFRARAVRRLADEDAKAGTLAAQNVGPEYLDALSEALGDPIYWLGERPGFTYELTLTRVGIYVRYLPRGAYAGDPAKHTLVATYYLPGAYRALGAAGRRGGSVVLRTPGGGEAFIDQRHRKNVYLAYPHSSWEIEVFDPSPGRARRLVVGGQVRPVRAEGQPAPPAPPAPSA